MSTGTFGNVDQVKTSIHIRGKLALQEIDDNTPGGRGLHVLLADRGRGIHHHNPHAAAAGLQRQLLRHELRALVGTDHVRQRHGRILVGGMAISRKSDGRHARSVHHTAHPAFPRRFQNRASAVHVGAIHLVRIAYPQPVVGRHVKNRIAASHRFFQRRRIAQIAGGSLCLEPLEIARIAAGTHQQSKVRSLLAQNPSHVGAEKSRCTCNKSLQKQFSVLSSQTRIVGP